MHKSICTKTQRKLIFVPFANIAIPFIWLRNCKQPTDVWNGTWRVLVSLLPFAAIQFLCAQCSDFLSVVSACVAIYFAPMLMGYVLIRYQESLEANTYSKKRKPMLAWINSKKVLFIFILGLLALAIIVSAVFIIIDDYKEKNIPDQNGPDDISLAVLTLDDLTSEQMRSVSICTRENMQGGSTDAPDKYSEYDWDYLQISIRSMSGVRTIHATKVACKQLTLSIESSLTAGNAAIVVLVDGEYYCDIEINKTDRVTLEDVSGKLVEVRLAGESAEVEVSITRVFK